MTTNLSKELHHRLACSKYLFKRACGLLDRDTPFSSGIAVLGFHDAAEMFLRVIAEHHHVSLKDNVAFNQILDAIDSKLPQPLSHRSALNQMNRARLNFKHFGLEPKKRDAVKFRRDLEAFLPTSCFSCLGVDFDHVSLIDLIGHLRTENQLRAAEEEFRKAKYETSINAAAIAFAAYRKYLNRRNRRDRFRAAEVGFTWAPAENSNIKAHLAEFAEEVESRLETVEERVDLLSYGVNLADYRRFRALVPDVTFSDIGIALLNSHNAPESIERDEAQLCLQFALDSILLMKEGALERPGQSREQHDYLTIRRKTAVIVYPTPDKEEIELLRVANTGERLHRYSSRWDTEEYFAVIQDDELAYVSRADVEDPIG